MKASRLRLVLRCIAIAIAIAGVIDPVWTKAAPPSRTLIAIDLTDGASDQVVAALQAAAPRWKIERRRATGHRLPCAFDERCVVIADGSADVELPDEIRALSAILVRRTGEPNVALRGAVVPAGHAAAAGAARVEIARSGLVPATEIRVRDDRATVGAVTHTWGDEQAATIEVPWWPIGTGARALRIEAVPIEGEAITFDNTIDVGAVIESAPLPALIFDTRPSWGSTFVRRALEDDARFTVSHRARLAPGLTAGTMTGTLDAPSLDRAPVVIVGGPDALTAGDVALLERYVSERGGSLILLPERQIDGPARRLIGDGWREHLVAKPEAIGPLRASEILRLERAPAVSTVLGASGSSPAIVDMPHGRGRVIVSGAMDAWRYRDPATGQSPPAETGSRRASAFDTVWTSLVADAALAGSGLRIDLESTLAAAGERVPFTVRARSLAGAEAVEARVTFRCPGVETPVRVWPAGEPSVFDGELPAVERGPCEVTATVGSQTATTALAVAARPQRGVARTLDNLERATRAVGGVVIDAGQEADLAASLDDSTADSSQIVFVRPMHVAWWIVPFAGCLAGEWWLRRRNGLR